MNPAEVEKSEAWMAAGACVTTSGVDFFPGPNDRAGQNRAKAVCARCPVQERCGQYAITERIEHGIWGGMGERERVRARRGLTIVHRPGASDRVRRALTAGPLTARQLQERLGMSMPAVHSALQHLARCGEVTSTPVSGQRSYLYQLCGGGPST